jgi:hypothetical protein
VKLKGSLKVNFVRAGIIEPKGGDTVFESIDDAATYVNEKLLQEDSAYNSRRSGVIKRKKVDQSQ